MNKEFHKVVSSSSCRDPASVVGGIIIKSSTISPTPTPIEAFIASLVSIFVGCT